MAMAAAQYSRLSFVNCYDRNNAFLNCGCIFNPNGETLAHLPRPKIAAAAKPFPDEMTRALFQKYIDCRDPRLLGHRCGQYGGEPETSAITLSL